MSIDEQAFHFPSLSDLQLADIVDVVALSTADPGTPAPEPNQAPLERADSPSNIQDQEAAAASQPNDQPSDEQQHDTAPTDGDAHPPPHLPQTTTPLDDHNESLLVSRVDDMAATDPPHPWQLSYSSVSEPIVHLPPPRPLRNYRWTHPSQTFADRINDTHVDLSRPGGRYGVTFTPMNPYTIVCLGGFPYERMMDEEASRFRDYETVAKERVRGDELKETVFSDISVYDIGE